MRDIHFHLRFPLLCGAFSLLCGSLGMAGCNGNEQDLPPLPDLPSGASLAVASTDYTVGALHSIDLATLTVRKNIDVLDAQPVVRTYGTNLYVLDQTHGAMRIYDLTQNFANPHDYPIGKDPQVPAAQANPYDIYVDAPRNLAYVTLYGSYMSTAVTGAYALGVIDLTNPSAGISNFIALPVAAGDPDNNPEAARLSGCGDKLMILLQDLDRTASYAPVAAGRLAVLSLTNPSQVNIIQLAGENPTALTVLPGCTQAIVGSAGNQLAGTLQGVSGVEVVDLVGMQSKGLVFTDSSLGGNVSTLDALDVDDVFVDVSVVNGTNYDNYIYLVDALAGTRSQQLLGPMGFVPAVHVFANRLVVLNAGSPAQGTSQLMPGVFIGPLTGAALSTEPTVDLGQLPISADLYTH